MLPPALGHWFRRTAWGLVAFGYGLCLGPQWTQAADPDAPPSTELRSPLSPEESLRHFRLADPDLLIEVAACEPHVVDPIALRFDELGRMWVVEMRDYPNGPAEGATPLSRIVTLADPDGDGHFDQPQVFAEGLLFATGLQPWAGGVFVTLAGEVAYLKDTDGDGRADFRETWFTGFVQQNPQLRANHPTLAPDGWIYVANGLRGGKVVDARHPERPPVSISGRDFRFHPLTGACEAVAGNGQFGLTFDETGERFVCDNRHPVRHVVLEEADLAGNPQVAVPAVMHDAAAADTASRVYPLSRAWTTSNLHAGQFTAACGLKIFRSGALGDAYQGAALVCEPTGNLVHAASLAPVGGTFAARPLFEEQEFLATPDEWFRPVNLETGPDGALYIVDMYRAVIEHPEWVPEELKRRPDERFGDDRGRIYRVRRQGARLPPAEPFSAKTATDALVRRLDTSNVWERDTVARLVQERHFGAPPEDLENLLVNGAQSGSRIAAFDLLLNLYLATYDSPTEKDQAYARRLRIQFEDNSPAARRHAWKRARHLLKPEERLAAANRQLAFDRNPGVRFQVWLAVAGANPQPDEALALAALRNAADPWSRQAVLLAVADDQLLPMWHAVLLAWSQSQDSSSPQIDPSSAEALLTDLVVQLAAVQGKETAAAALDHLLSGADSTAQVRRRCLQAYSAALGRKGVRLADALATQGDAALQQRWSATLNEILSLATAAETPAAERALAIRLLGQGGEAHRQALQALWRDSEPQETRLAALAAWAEHRDPGMPAALLEGFTARTPAERRAILDACLARTDGARQLLEEIAAQRIAATELDQQRAERLRKHADPAIAQQATSLLKSTLPADRQQVLIRYQPVLQLAADATRGQEIFRKNCSTCHRVGGIGVDVAPDISDSRTKTPLQLLTDILQPNRAIDSNYISYAVQTTDGQQHLGVLAAETANSVTIKLPEAKVVTLLRSEIEALNSTGLSLMPDGLERTIPEQDMADLVSFIKNWRYLDGRTPTGP